MAATFQGQVTKRNPPAYQYNIKPKKPLQPAAASSATGSKHGVPIENGIQSSDKTDHVKNGVIREIKASAAEKEVFNLYDDNCEGKIDCMDVGTAARALGLKPTNEMVWKACGKEYKKAGEKKFTLDEFMPIYNALKKEKTQATYNDYVEGLKPFDKEEQGKIMSAELKVALMSLGEGLTHAQMDEVLEGVPDANGMVNYAEFVKKLMAGPFPEQAS